MRNNANMKIPPKDTIFRFYRYLQPIWYFNLCAQSQTPYWVDYRKLANEDRRLIDFDSGYTTKTGALRDAAYQALQKGVICFNPEHRLGLVDSVALVDEYRFVRKYFNPFWGIYVLVIRILTLHNPFHELRAFLLSLKVERSRLFEFQSDSTRYEEFDSGLIRSQPLVSVIIPTLNRYVYLKDVLGDLQNQTYKNFEVIVVDQSEPFQKDFYNGWDLRLNVIHQREKALWQARNFAIKLANGEMVLLYDDDSRVENSWINEHLKCLDFFNADFSAGVSLSRIGARIPENYSIFRWADQFDTGNVMIRKGVFRKIGLFDRQFEKQRMGDGEFGLRAYLCGIIGVSNPQAKRVHLKVESGGLRQMGSWDGFRPTNWFAPRPIPSVLYYSRRYFGNEFAILDLLIKVPASILPLQYKRKPVILLVASVVALLMFPLIVYQVIRSWKIASKMIAEGPKIGELH
jgi:glycosyltransferase involved in cell wall biosynthesis